MGSLQTKEDLGRKTIAILAGDGFEYVELAVPRAALDAANARTEVVSLHHGRIRGMNVTEPTKTVKVDRTFGEADPARYDGALVVGGFVGPDLVRQSEPARAFVRQINAANKPIAVLCHGPWLLVSAGITAGRKLASWPGIRDDIVNAAGVWRDEPVVVDGNLVSSRGPQDLVPFVRAMLELFARGPKEEDARTPDLESSPQPIAPPAIAVEVARAAPGPLVWIAAGAALVAGAGLLAVRRALG